MLHSLIALLLLLAFDGSAPPPTPPPVVEAQTVQPPLTLRDQLALVGWPARLLDQALAVVHCESRGDPAAVGDHGASLGLFQLNTGWFRPGELPFDLDTNARVALRVALGDEARGYNAWSAWSCKP